MATRTDNDVTLPHDMAERAARMLSDYADSNLDHARRTKSAPVRNICRRDAAAASEIALNITRKLWAWQAND